MNTFLALSKADQQEFINVLTIPGYEPSSRKFEPSVDTQYLTEYYTEYRSEKNSSIQSALASTTTWEAWTEYTYTLLGIDIFKIRIELGYNADGNTVTSINYNSAFVVKNLNPVVQSETISCYAYISGGKAIAKAAWSYSLGPLQDLSVQISTIYGTLTSSPSGTSWDFYSA